MVKRGAGFDLWLFILGMLTLIYVWSVKFPTCNLDAVLKLVWR